MRKVVGIIGGLFMYGSLFAQQNTADSTDISDMEKRMTSLEKITSALPKISGFINVRYQYNGESNSFDIRRARLDFKGDLATKLDYRFQMEFAGSPKILDAYLRCKIDRRFNLQVGEFKIPFSMENIYGPTTLETADNSMAISNLCNYNDISGISANGRDVGIGLYGGFIKKDGYNIIDYAVGIFNGNGINIKDNNKSKDFSGRLTISPMRHLSFSGYYYKGSYGKEGETHGRVRVGCGAKWEDLRLLLRSEYIYGKTGGIESDGVYIVAGYFVHPKVQPILKYDYFLWDKSDSHTAENDYLIGLNYFPMQKLRLQLNYVYKMLAARKDVNSLTLQFFALF